MNISHLGKFGVHNQWDLLSIAEKANPPENAKAWAHTCRIVFNGNWHGDVTFRIEGWLIRFYYDAGELDYITDFTAPDGTVIDFWEWDDNHPWKNDLVSWRKVGDLARLRTNTK